MSEIGTDNWTFSNVVEYPEIPEILMGGYAIQELASASLWEGLPYAWSSSCGFGQTIFWGFERDNPLECAYTVWLLDGTVIRYSVIGVGFSGVHPEGDVTFTLEYNGIIVDTISFHADVWNWGDGTEIIVAKREAHILTVSYRGITLTYNKSTLSLPYREKYENIGYNPYYTEQDPPGNGMALYKSTHSVQVYKPTIVAVSGDAQFFNM
jgi:hypothetical protein